MSVPGSFLSEFFYSATKKLNECILSSPTSSLADIRLSVLSTQRACLDDLLAGHNKTHKDILTVEEVQDELKRLPLELDQLDPSVKRAMDEMNEAARSAFARLVLHSAALQQRDLSDQVRLKDSVSMKRGDILEFCGLCNSIVHVESVEKYLVHGSPIFEDVELPPPTETLPESRLELIQRLFLHALGYEADHGKDEIKRIFFTQKPNEFSGDTFVIETFASMASQMNTVLINANMKASQEIFSDVDQGGVTRIVEVKYSEKVIDEKGEAVASDSLPLGQQRMEQQTEDQQRHQLKMAQEAAALQQEILGELLSMRDEVREEKLAEAQRASETVLKKVMQASPGPERVELLRSIDSRTQRLMAMHKLWEGMLAANGGNPPRVHC